MKQFLPLAWLVVVLLLPVAHLYPEEILVSQDGNGVVTVSNRFTTNNRIIKKSKRVRFVKSRGAVKVPTYYLAKINKLSKKYDLKASLIIAVAKAESSFNPFAVSHKGAVGIMQLMPATARQYGVQNRYNVDQNLEAGVKHLKYLYTKYKKNIPLTLAAYNAGEEAVKKYRGVPPYRETRTYIKRIMNYMGLGFSSYFQSTSKPGSKIYKIVSKDGKITITDTLPSRIAPTSSISIID